MARGGHSDDPPFSRLFVLCGKKTEEDELKQLFGDYGTLEDVWLVKDRATGIFKGVAYIKFSKASEAASAMEALNGKFVDSAPKGLKVILANKKEEGSRVDNKEEEKMLRLFCIIPSEDTKEDVKEHFEQFGKVQSVMINEDKVTGKRKNFGYVSFFRASHAAKALEECDRKYKPKFAEPRGMKRVRENSGSYDDRSWGGRSDRSGDRYSDRSFYGDRDRHGDRHRDEDRYMDRRRLDRGYGTSGDRGYGGRDMGSRDIGGSSHLMDYGVSAKAMQPGFGMDLYSDVDHENCTNIQIVGSVTLSKGQIMSLCDLIPGLVNVEGAPSSSRMTSSYFVKYSTPQCASYAKAKLHGFEYPIGAKLVVTYSEDQADPSSVQSNLATLAESIAKAGNLLQKAGMGNSIRPDAAQQLNQLVSSIQNVTQGGSMMDGNQAMDRISYTNIPLPPPKPMLSLDTPVAQKTFVVFNPEPIPIHIMEDLFCRFGDMIEAYIVPGRNFGYVKYASKRAAEEAMSVVHGQEVCNSRLKVLPAEESRQEKAKRLRQEQIGDGDTEMRESWD
ncbi:unnamed protein product [Owenia fusiformis]|uniref:Uncharacterized protein n=1 Tax=Owenia fusiformis TaxID=6347 RepID=A0A8J1XRT6_OWEFU|nr:unnamed protein product [Owenia fusiformis]